MTPRIIRKLTDRELQLLSPELGAMRVAEKQLQDAVSTLSRVLTLMEPRMEEVGRVQFDPNTLSFVEVTGAPARPEVLASPRVERTLRIASETGEANEAGPSQNPDVEGPAQGSA